jgi:hypothetical protein
VASVNMEVTVAVMMVTPLPMCFPSPIDKPTSFRSACLVAACHPRTLSRPGSSN